MNTGNNEYPEMVGVALKELWMGPKVPCNLYVRLDSGKFVLIAKAQTETDVEGMAVFRNNKIDKVYIRKFDYRKLVSRKLAETDVIMSHPDIAADKKTYFLKTALHTVIGEITDLGPTNESIGHAKQISCHAVELINSRPQLSELLRALQLSNDWVINHGMGTCVFSVMIAKEMGWQNTQTLEKLALGSVLQDIGLKELPEPLYTKQRIDLTAEERNIFETHPERSFKLLQSVGDIPDDVLSIVFEHHENAMGLGFPRHVRDVRMNPLAKVVSLANTLCEVTMVNPENATPRGLQQAVDYIETVMGQPFNREAFRALKELVKNGRPRLAPVKVA